MDSIRKNENSAAKDGKRKFSFDQPVPIQSYLIAIAAGNIVSKRIGPRSFGLYRLSSVFNFVKNELASDSLFL